MYNWRLLESKAEVAAWFCSKGEKVSTKGRHSEDRASWYILIIKPMRCTNFSNLSLE